MRETDTAGEASKPNSRATALVAVYRVGVMFRIDIIWSDSASQVWIFFKESTLVKGDNCKGRASHATRAAGNTWLSPSLLSSNNPMSLNLLKIGSGKAEECLDWSLAPQENH